MIHERLTDLGFDSDELVANGLVVMFGKLRCMQRAKEVFDGMKHRTTVSWNSLITAYAENEEPALALDAFHGMDCERDSFTYVAGFKACGALVSQSAGERIHSRLCRQGLEHDQTVANALMDFYVRCGCLPGAEMVFNSMHTRNVVSWNTVIGGFSAAGEMSRVFGLTAEMEEAGVPFVGVTFTSVLSAYSHRGMVDEAKRLFDSAEELGIERSVEHCNCMVDVLGRANRLPEALALIESMPAEATNNTTWMTLLGGCRRWKNREVGRVAFDKLVQLHPE